LFANIAHGVVSALLFFIVGGLKERWGSADLATARAALREVSPRLGIALVVGFAASLGLPGLVGFWGEFLAMYAAWNPAPGRPQTLMRVLVVLAVLGAGVAAAYSLRVLRLIWSGDRTTPAHEDARGAEWSVLAVLVTAVLVLGVAPGLLLSSTYKDAAAITMKVSR
jgi:NADH-quinone oxidoreductase subunit M